MNTSAQPSGPAPHQVPLSEDFSAFYQREYRPVATLLLALTRSATVAEDIAQDAFLRAHRHWDDIARHPNPEAWIRRVASNLAISRFRRLRAEARALLRLGPAPVAMPPAEPAADDFWTQVRSLPTRQAQIVALHYIEDRSVRDIAAVLEITEGTVKTQLHRARKKLAQRLGQPPSETPDSNEEVTA